MLIVDDKKAEAAAITIQSTYRGYKTRKEIKPKLKTFNNSNNNDYLNHTELETVKEEDDKTTLNNNSIDNNNANDNLDDSKELDQAAIKIQATYRGFKTRKELKKGID
jgi:hypothetical protein